MPRRKEPEVDNTEHTLTSNLDIEDETSPYSLRIVSSPDPRFEGETILMEPQEVVFGRDTSHTPGPRIGAGRVRLPDPRSSRSHARLFPFGERSCLEDLGSKNGTWINGVRCREATLIEPHDVIRLGDTMMT